MNKKQTMIKFRADCSQCYKQIPGSTFEPQFCPMSYFTKKLFNRQAGFVEFHFNGLETIYGRKFHVTVLCDSCQHVHFTMQECKGGWEIINAPQPPQWITNFENDLARAINEYLAETVQILT